MKRVYAGIDLHSSNNFIGIIDETDKRLYGKKLPNDTETILKALEPFRENLVGVAIESTYNWYWLVDDLMEEEYRVRLANPSAIRQYEGLKHTDDKWDAFWLAHMLRLGILPVGHIYPKEERPVRDLLRKRLFFVRQRTALILSLQGMMTRNLGVRFSGNKIKSLTERDAEEMFGHPCLASSAKSSIITIRHLAEGIRGIERMNRIRG